MTKAEVSVLHKNKLTQKNRNEYPRMKRVY